MDSKQALDKLGDISTAINCLIFHTGSEFGEPDENIEYKDSPDDRMMGNEIYRLLDKLTDIKKRIEYLKKPIIVEGVLRKNENNYYELISKGKVEKVYHAGTPIEALIKDDDKLTWEITRVEHNGLDYYLVGNSGVKLEGLKVRIREM